MHETMHKGKSPRAWHLWKDASGLHGRCTFARLWGNELSYCYGTTEFFLICGFPGKWVYSNVKKMKGCERCTFSRVWGLVFTNILIFWVSYLVRKKFIEIKLAMMNEFYVSLIIIFPATFVLNNSRSSLSSNINLNSLKAQFQPITLDRQQ